MREIRDIDKAKLFTRRSVLVGLFQGALLGVLGGRLAWLQIVDGARYQTLAEKNRINIRMLAPERGQIVDRFGVPLAGNNQNFRIVIVPEQAGDVEEALRALQKRVALKDSAIEKVLQQARRAPGFAAIEVRDALEWEDVARIEVNLPDLPGISVNEGEIRAYPFGSATAHLIGYVGAVSRAEQTGDPVLTLPGFRIGKTGIEKTYDTPLRGTAGSAQVEINVRGREIRELRVSPPLTGQKITLTIDSELQQLVQTRLAQETSASAVIMDAHSGAVYALASNPAFDPNLFTRGVPADIWEELLADPAHPLINKAVAGQYPPASTFKMVTVLAGLESGVITRNTTVYCPGHYDYGGDRFHCWKRGGHGWVDLPQALAVSCDTFFYKISTDIGIDKIADMAERLGLGQRYNFDLGEERPGLVPRRTWKRAQFGESWQHGETIVASIGQGYLLTTPLQLAVMTARLVNGGKAVRPWMTALVGQKPIAPSGFPDLGINAAHLDLVRRGMDRVITHTQGTAHGSRIGIPDKEMGGKTGTAQVRRITKQQRLDNVRNEDLPRQHRHHALFVGYAPLSAPRYVCAVVVEHGVGGSRTAAPLARDIMIHAQERDPAAHAIQQPEDAASQTPVPMRKPRFGVLSSEAQGAFREDTP